MRRWTTFAALGGIWGGGFGLFFGPFPAGAIVWGVLERLTQPSDEHLLFAGFWGACVLLSGILGIVTGSLFSRLEPTTVRRHAVITWRPQHPVWATQRELEPVSQALSSP